VDVPGFADGCARHRVLRGGYPTREAAKQSLAELRRPDLRAGVDPSIPTGAWLRTWLTSRISLAPISAHGYATHVRLYLEPFLDRIPLNELRTAQIQEMFTQLAPHGAAGIPLSPNTLARVRATLRAALNAAIRDRLITDNPARYLELPTPRRPRAVIWTEERIAEWRATGIHPTIAVWTAAQTARFLTATRTHRLYAAFHLIAPRGLRRAETSGSDRRHLRQRRTGARPRRRRSHGRTHPESRTTHPRLPPHPPQQQHTPPPRHKPEKPRAPQKHDMTGQSGPTPPRLAPPRPHRGPTANQNTPTVAKESGSDATKHQVNRHVGCPTSVGRVGLEPTTQGL
jgi:hypothetical protein